MDGPQLLILLIKFIKLQLSLFDELRLTLLSVLDLLLSRFCIEFQLLLNADVLTDLGFEFLEKLLVLVNSTVILLLELLLSILLTLYRNLNKYFHVFQVLLGGRELLPVLFVQWNLLLEQGKVALAKS